MAYVMTTETAKVSSNRLRAADADGQALVDKFWEDHAASYSQLMKPGKAFPKQYYPKQVKIETGDEVFDYHGIKGMMIMSDRLKCAVEDIEPDVHQFVPVEMLNRDGSPYGGKFWFWSICTMLDVINPELGGVYKRGSEKYPDIYDWVIRSGEGMREKLAVYKDKIAGRAMWYDKRMYGNMFFCDALVDHMRAENMTGWETMSHWKEI